MLSRSESMRFTVANHSKENEDIFFFYVLNPVNIWRLSSVARTRLPQSSFVYHRIFCFVEAYFSSSRNEIGNIDANIETISHPLKSTNVLLETRRLITIFFITSFEK